VSRILAALSWMTLIAFIVGVSFAMTMQPGMTYFGDSLALRIIFGSFFVVMAGVVLGEFVLWICMLWFCIRWYDGAPLKRILAIGSQLIFLCHASAVLYFFVYRPQYNAHRAH
jgi:hypothetical protein